MMELHPFKIEWPAEKNEYDDHPEGPTLQWVFKFSNGYGASVIKGPRTMGGRHELWEMLPLKHEPNILIPTSFPWDFDIWPRILPDGDFDVLGWLTEDLVSEWLDQIARIPTERNTDGALSRT